MTARGDLAAARVLVVGVGGLGAPIALALGQAGVGTVGLADDDEVERTNLHRQVLFRDADVGRPKVSAGAEALARRFPRLTVATHATRFLVANAIDLARAYDLVVEGSDNFATKFLAADACKLADRPVIQAAAIGWRGTALAVSPRGAPCYRCVFEDIPREHAPNCAEAGVLGPVVGVVGALAADLAIRHLAGADVAGTLVTFDARASEPVRRRTVRARPDCPLCGAHPEIARIDVRRYVADTAAYD